MSFSDIKGFDSVLRRSADDLAETIMQAADPNKAAEKVKEVVRQVLEKASDSPMEISKAKQFLSKIEAVNQKIIDTKHISPFKTAVKRLHEKFDEVIGPKLTSPPPQQTKPTSPTPKPTLSPPPESPSKPTSSIQKLKHAFEKQITESPVKPLPAAGTVKKKVIIGTQITFSAIKDKIKGLDLSSDTLSEKINEIKRDLKNLKPTEISAEQIKVLSDALDSLKQDSSSFKPSRYETLFLDHCAAKNPGLKKAQGEKLPDIVKSVQQGARSQMLETIKKSLETPESLITTISKKNEEFEVELPKKRFHDLPVRNSPPFNNHFEKNLPQVLRAFESFSKKAMKFGLGKKWESYLARLEKSLGSDFVKALQKHPSCNPAANYEDLLQMMQKEYLELFDLKKINESATITTYLDTLKEPVKQQALSFFDEIYKTNFQKKTVWFTQNYNNVEKAYDQSVDPNTNLGSGVCFSNCLDRTNKLLTTPALPSKDIAMGSTEASRVAHNLYRREISAKKEKGPVSQEDMDKVEKDTAKRLGLTLTKKLTVPYNEADPTKNLGTILEQAYREGGQKASPILSLYGPGRGHAINIQMDKAAGQFRFLDDNFGIIGKYDTFEEFKEAFVEYIKAAYEDYNQFSLLSYSLPS